MVVPVAHICYFRSLPNKIGYLLGLPTKKLDSIIYYEKYVIIQAGVAENAEKNIKDFELLGEEEYYDIIDNLKIKPQQVIGYISGTKQGQKQAEANGFRFYGATWDTNDLNVLSTGTTISKPTEIIDILEGV